MSQQVVVVGLGAAGAGALWGLAKRGVKPIGIEQFPIGHDRGSSHGRSRLFRGGAAEGAAYVDLAARSLEIWRDLEARSGTEIVTLTGGVTIGKHDSELLEDTAKAMDERQLPFKRFNADELRSRYPQHRIEDGDEGILDPGTGVARPELAITTAIDAATASGAQVIQAEVSEIRHHGATHEVILNDGSVIEADEVIVAAGAWNGRLVPELTADFTVRRAVLSWFTPKPGHEAEFTPDVFPVFTREDEFEIGWGAAALDDYGVKVGLHQQDGYEISDPYVNKAEVETWELEAVQGFVSRQFPNLEPVAQHPHGCMITVTQDEDFSIGRLHDGTILLAACSGHGFKHSAAVGDLGARIALGEDPEMDLALFDPYRFTSN
ncbi:MAG: N-methyl-L-tryptophan oxidase [Galactobacter sp.]